MANPTYGGLSAVEFRIGFNFWRIMGALVIVLALIGCGKKQWPQPKDEREGFSFSDVRGERRPGQCLIVSAELEGVWRSMDSLVLELTSVDPVDSCTSCPFRAELQNRFSGPNADFVQRDAKVQLRRCGLDDTATYRWRLVGISKHSAVPPVLSPEKITPAPHHTSGGLNAIE